MRILIILSILSVGTSSGQLSSTSKYCEAIKGVQPLSVSLYSAKSDYNTHVHSHLNSELPSGSFNKPASSAIQGSFKSYVPSFKQGLFSTESPITETGNFLSSGLHSSRQQHHVQSLFAGTGIGSPSGFSAHIFPNSISYHAVSSTSSPTSYVNPTSTSDSFSFDSIPVQKQGSSYKSSFKTLDTISAENDNRLLSPTFGSQHSSFVASNSESFAHSPTVSTKKPFSLNFEKSDTVLASRFLPITDQTVTTTSKPSVNIPSSSSVTILTPPTPTASSTPYAIPVITPVPTTFPQANFGTVTQSYYPPTTFKPYSTSQFIDNNSIFSTPRPFNRNSRVFSKPVPFSSTNFPSGSFKTVTQYPTASTAFKSFSPLSKTYDSIYSTPIPLNSYSRVISTASPVTTSALTTDLPKGIFTSDTSSSYPSTTFKPYSTPSYNNYNSVYSTYAPLKSYSGIFSTPVPLKSNIIKSSSVSNSAPLTENNFFSQTQNVVPSIINFTTITKQSKAIETSFNPFSLKQTSSLLTKPFVVNRLSPSYSGIFSTPSTISTTPSSFSVYKSSTPKASSISDPATLTTPIPSIVFPQVNFKAITAPPYSSTTFKSSLPSSSLPYSYNSIYSTSKPLSSYSKVFTTPIPVVSNLTNSNAFSSKYTNIFSEPYPTNGKSSLSSNVFSSPSTPSSSFSILTSPAPISPTPYSATVRTPSLSTAFLKENFETITSTPSYPSSTYKPYTTTASYPYTYSSGFSTQAPIIPNTFKFSVAGNAGKTEGVTASQSFKPNVDLTSRFDTVHSPPSHASVFTTPQRIESFSFNYPKSNNILGSSSGFNSKPGISQTSYSGESLVPLSFRSINSGLFDLPASNQHTYYSENLSPTFKVAEKTLYSPPVPISFSSNPELYSSSAYFSTLENNARLSSVHSPGAFGLTVQKAPLTKEFHTVEEPIVKTWKSIDSWNPEPVSHFRSLFN